MTLIILSILSIIILFLSLRKDGIILKKKKGENQGFSFSKYAWSQFKKNKIALISLYVLALMVIVAIFAPQIANDKPLYAVYKGKTIYPALHDLPFGKGEAKYEISEEEIIEFNNMTSFDWRTLKYESVIWPLITYSPKTQDPYNRDYKSPNSSQKYMDHNGKETESPFKFRHHLGTDLLGRDLASGLIHGTRTALKVGIISMGIASLFGILLGALAGFFGDRRLKMKRSKYYFSFLGIFLGLFYAWRPYEITMGLNKGINSGLLEMSISLLILISIFISLRILSKKLPGKFFNKEISVPVDSFVSRGIELLNSIPRILLIITVTAVQKEPSLNVVMVIIGLTSWTGIARFTRAELLRIRNLEYISASNALGFSSIRTIFKHALPNALAPVFVSIAFGIASAILIESSLSFLGIGVPADEVTWGGLLNLGRLYHEAWWLIIYPGIAIFITITVYNMIAEAARDALDPKLKS